MELFVTFLLSPQVGYEILAIHQVVEFHVIREEDDFITRLQFANITKYLSQCIVVPGKDDISPFARVPACFVMSYSVRGRFP